MLVKMETGASGGGSNFYHEQGSIASSTFSVTFPFAPSLVAIVVSSNGTIGGEHLWNKKLNGTKYIYANSSQCGWGSQIPNSGGNGTIQSISADGKTFVFGQNNGWGGTIDVYGMA